MFAMRIHSEMGLVETERKSCLVNCIVFYVAINYKINYTKRQPAKCFTSHNVHRSEINLKFDTRFFNFSRVASHLCVPFLLNEIFSTSGNPHSNDALRHIHVRMRYARVNECARARTRTINQFTKTTATTATKANASNMFYCLYTL